MIATLGLDDNELGTSADVLLGLIAFLVVCLAGCIVVWLIALCLLIRYDRRFARLTDGTTAEERYKDV